MNNLAGKKILILGGIGPMADLVTLAHRNGVKVGVADYNKGTYVKKIADYQYDINILDIDAVVDLCKSEGYDGVISNFNDMLSPYVAKVCELCGYYCPYSIEQLRMSTDKKYFKDMCLKYGVSVPKEYHIHSENDVISSDIQFPVIVKPVDGSGSKGISICESKESLIQGIRKAKEYSKSDKVIVEEYVDGDEINVTYIADNGVIQLAAIHDRYFNTSQKGFVQVPDLYIYPSRYTTLFVEKYNKTVINMLRGIGIKNGSLFMQACVKDGKIYIYEAGMRLNGCKTYQILEYENDFNTFEHLLQYALTGEFGFVPELTPFFKQWYATINVLGRPGEITQTFEGIHELNSYPWLIHIARAYYEGDKIPDNAAGTLIQDTTRIHVSGRTKEELISHINTVNRLYQIYNENGENIILTPHNTDAVLDGLDYDLR